MAVKPEQIYAPIGPIESSLFPGEVIGDDTTEFVNRIQTNIEKAEARAAQDGVATPALEEDQVDAAIASYTCHLLFRAAFVGFVSRPATVDTDTDILGSETFEEDQRKALESLAQDYLNDYFRFVALVPSTPAAAGTPSYQSRNEYDY